MPTRHRVPTVFTLYMVDVLCCALGCMILLWFLKIHEARSQVQEAERREREAADISRRLDETRQQLAGVIKERDDTRRQRDAARTQLADLNTEIARLKSQKAKAQEALATALKQQRELSKEMANVQAEKSTLEERLTKAGQDQASLSRELALAKKRGLTLAKLVQDKEALAKSAARSADDLAQRLRDTDARVKKLLALADLIPGLREDVRTYRDKTASLEALALKLERELAARKQDLAGAGKNVQNLEETKRRLIRELAAAQRSIESLQGEKKTLNEQVSRERAASANRFAGIALTGRRVVFLVDMSGSMELVDERTPAPAKWTGVREALAKVMHSLPELEKFQVVLFSDRASYLIGNGDRWLDFDPRTSVERVVAALRAIKPRGNTDMYAAFEAAFRFRPVGLDTIYLFSDGLPNIGEGLTPESARNLTETQRAEVLSKHIRKTLASAWNTSTAAGQPRVRINAIGFFYESPDVGAFLWALARENDGSFVGMSKP